MKLVKFAFLLLVLALIVYGFHRAAQVPPQYTHQGAAP